MLDAVAAAVATAVLVVVGAGCRVAWWAIRGLDRWFDRRVSHPVALVGTVVVVTMQLFMQYVAWHGFQSRANNVYSTADRGTDPASCRRRRRACRAARGHWCRGTRSAGKAAGATPTAQQRRFHGVDAEVVDPHPRI